MKNISSSIWVYTKSKQNNMHKNEIMKNAINQILK